MFGTVGFLELCTGNNRLKSHWFVLMYVQGKCDSNRFSAKVNALAGADQQFNM